MAADLDLEGVINSLEAPAEQKRALVKLAAQARTLVDLAAALGIRRRDAQALLQALERRNLVQVVDGRDRRRPDEVLYELHPLIGVRAGVEPAFFRVRP